MENDNEHGAGNMRPCGCHRGRPCTCEMGRRLQTLEYACGDCINCQLNAKAMQKKRKALRKCVKYDAFMAEKAFERLEVAPGCVLRVRRPDWDVTTKSAFYTRMRQLRLGLQALRIETSIVIEKQKVLRKKYNRDLVQAEEAIRRIEEARTTGIPTRKMAADVTHVDSDVFDFFSKQLIPAEILLPDVRARIEAATESIATHERRLSAIEFNIHALAATKLQVFARLYIRSQRWKRLWRIYQEDVSWAAAVTIQATFRMSRYKQTIRILRNIRIDAKKRNAAKCLFAFFCRMRLARRIRAKQSWAEELEKLRIVKTRAAALLFTIAEKIVCRLAFWLWRTRHHDATANDERKVNKAVLVIQRYWRGIRERLQYRRVRYRGMLSQPVRELFDRFVCHGDIWRLLFETDATIKRYQEREHQENEDASTFVKSFVNDKRAYEDRLMQHWFHASAMESPIVKGALSLKSAFDLDSGNPEAEAFSLAESVIQSPLSKELIGFSPNRSKSEVFPDDLPPDVIRQAIYEGFNISETVAVMRGLVAQGRDASNVKTVLQVLKNRAPLMRNAWKPERAHRLEARPLIDVLKKRQKAQKSKLQPMRSKKQLRMPRSGEFLSNNMLANIPGGLRGSVDRLLFVAGMKCFDPTQGKFVFRLDASTDPWRSYTDTSCPLTKIRREQVVHDAIKPYTRTLNSKLCYTGFDILHRARGVEELVSWEIPRPLANAVYDVIELLHKQTVNSSDKRVERQIFISAQFQVFAEKKHDTKCTPSNKIEHLNACLEQQEDNKSSPCTDIQEIASAINKSVLDLPINDIEMPAQDVLFKAYFLICDGSPSDSTNQLSSALSRAHYENFLKQVLAKQTTGDIKDVESLVRSRVHVASHLAEVAAFRIQKHGILRAYDIMRNGFDEFKEEVLATTIRDLLQPLSRDEPHSTESAKSVYNRKLPKTTVLPLIHRKHTSLSTLDPMLQCVNIPL